MNTVIKAAVCFGLMAFFLSMNEPAMAEKKYLTYETFKAITALCPEVRAPRLGGLPTAGQDLWAKGQMRIPAETHLFEGDFSHDGKIKAAIAITDGGKHYVVIAEAIGAKWRRTGFIPIPAENITNWNGRALRIGETSFITWSGTDYRLECGPLAIYCNDYEPAAFMGVMIKLTYVGAQDEPYPGLLISSFYHWPNLESFKSHRMAGISYANDDHTQLWHLALSPEELRQFAIALNQSQFLPAAEDRTGSEAVSHSVSLLDESSSRRPNYYEVLLMSKESVVLLDQFARRLERKNADGAQVLREYAKMFGG